LFFKHETSPPEIGDTGDRDTNIDVHKVPRRVLQSLNPPRRITSGSAERYKTLLLIIMLVFGQTRLSLGDAKEEYNGKKGDFLVHFSTLLHLPPLRFHCVVGCWDRTQVSCDRKVDRLRSGIKDKEFRQKGRSGI
jgi:hypothetical protein